MRSLLFSAFSVFALVVVPASSFGSCGIPDSMKARLSLSTATSTLATPAARDQANSSADFERLAIAGLWNIKFVSGGQVVDQGFDAWQSDGLEVLNDTPPPATGNVCLGVYAQTGQRTFKLKHPSWIFDASNTNVIGTATIRETVTIDRSGDSFTGVFTIDVVDLFGNPLGHADGKVEAARLKVD
jgi:hypothetical protein